MLQIKNLNYSIGDRLLFRDVSWNIHPGKHIALIGPNGIGKTTLLKIIMNRVEYSSGQIIKPKDYRIGYLPQEEIPLDKMNKNHQSSINLEVLQAVLKGQTQLNLLENQIAELHNQLNKLKADENNQREFIMDRLSDLEQRYEALDGYHIEIIAKKVLSGLGFLESEFSKPVNQLSGGWRMRIYLAQLLVQKPDLLLLDEPTNHLDLPSLEWLEQYLQNFTGSVIIVSHDRFFVDRVAQEIVELDRGKLESFPGNYHIYEQKKEERDALLLKKWREQKEERERQERFINRFRYKDSKAKQVQSRIKQLEKMKIPDAPPPSPSPPKIDFTLNVEINSYNDVLSIKKMSFKYDSQWVFNHIDLNIYRGEKVCLVGPNGTGKTTLTRLITGQLKPNEGNIQIGERTTQGYYAQHQVDTLTMDNTIYDEVAATVATSLVPKIRDILGIFQFSGNDIYKKLNVLSGGEKARVALAKILISPVNFLIMDEPTNHLDKTAKEALERALCIYNGTLLIISHDRYFLDKIVNRVIEIRQGKLVEFDGNYSYYLQKRDNIENKQPIYQSESSSSTTLKQKLTNESLSFSPSAKKTKEQKRIEAEARQAISKQRNHLQKEIKSLEDKIELLENRKEEVEKQMANPETYNNSVLAVDLQKELAIINKDLNEFNQNWENAYAQLEDLMERLNN